MKYLSGYPAELVERVRGMIDTDTLSPWLRQRHPSAHAVRTDDALARFVGQLKAERMRRADPIAKICYDGSLQQLRNALGTHTTISRVQGARLKAKREIRIATVFRDMPDAFLRMIVAHELAHLREPGHDKAFYQLCAHIEPRYHQLEFEVRAYLCHLEAGGAPLWSA